MVSISSTASRLSVRTPAAPDGRPLQTQKTRRPNFKTILGPVGKPEQVTLYDQVADDGGGPRFWCPCIRPKMSVVEYLQQPIMFYLPGFDGSGMAASRQFPLLMEAFEFVSLTIPIDDGRPFSEIVDIFVDELKQYLGQNENGRPVYLLGESLGGLFAIAIAHRCPEYVDRMVLVNPATSYDQSIWPIVGQLLPMIPDELYTGVAFAIAPLLGNPLSLLAYKIDTKKSLPDQLESLSEGISELFGSLFFVGDVFTPERVALKLRLVQQGMEYTDPLIREIQQRTLLIVGEGDWMLPSGNEKGRLSGRMPRCYVRSMGLRAHALLQEGGVDLVQILKEEGFYVTQRRFTSQNDNKPVINRFGTASPIELPTDIEFQRISSFVRSNILTSPVFYSTNVESRVVEGLDGLPDTRPLLIVGNHQLMGIDSSTLLDCIFKEKGILVRGLAHPLLFEERNVSQEKNGSPLLRSETARALESFASTFGAVRVRPKNLHTLLRNGEWILLYPGGARESFHLRNEGYTLFWPEASEFVRMAAKFEATVVTVAAVGLEESLDIIIDRDQIMNAPILKEWIQGYLQRIPEARPGISNQRGDLFLPPLVRPKIPHRQYFLFGKPFVITHDCYQDKQKADALYKEIKQQLEDNIVYLQSKAKEDPYGNFLKRILYENTNGREQAPSFLP